VTPPGLQPHPPPASGMDAGFFMATALRAGSGAGWRTDRSTGTPLFYQEQLLQVEYRFQSVFTLKTFLYLHRTLSF